MTKLLIRYSIVWIVLGIGAANGLTQEPVTLVIYGEPGPDCSNPDNAWEFCLYSRALTDLWHEKHPNIQLEWVEAGGDAELYQALQEAIATGHPPDITIGESFLPLMMRDGLLLPLDLDSAIRANIVPGTAAYVTDENAVLYG